MTASYTACSCAGLFFVPEKKHTIILQKFEENPQTEAKNTTVRNVLRIFLKILRLKKIFEFSVNIYNLSQGLDLLQNLSKSLKTNDLI